MGEFLTKKEGKLMFVMDINSEVSYRGVTEFVVPWETVQDQYHSGSPIAWEDCYCIHSVHKNSSHIQPVKCIHTGDNCWMVGRQKRDS